MHLVKKIWHWCVNSQIVNNFLILFCGCKLMRKILRIFKKRKKPNVDLKKIIKKNQQKILMNVVTKHWIKSQKCECKQEECKDIKWRRILNYENWTAKDDNMIKNFIQTELFDISLD